MAEAQLIDVNPEELALGRCRELVAWYERAKIQARWLDYIVQGSVITAAGVTTLAAAVEAPRWLVVLPAVITSIATGFNTAFAYRSKYVNFAIAAERLKSEEVLFRIRRSQAESSKDALERFVERVEEIASAELARWQEAILSPALAREEKKRSESSREGAG
jgi:hypothetical protein